jgi:hypothetical protein
MKEKLSNAKDFALDNIEVIANTAVAVMISVGCYTCYRIGLKNGIDIMCGAIEAVNKTKSE